MPVEQMSAHEVLAKLKPVLPQHGYDVLKTMIDITKENKRHSKYKIMLRQMYRRHFGHWPEDKEAVRLLEPPANVEGPVQLGWLKYGDDRIGGFGLSLEELNEHLMILGSSGGGKTNTAQLLLGRLRQKGIPFILTDFKETYRSLIHTEEGKNILFFTLGSDVVPLYWNPMIPMEGTTLMDTIKNNILATSHAFYLGHGAGTVALHSLRKSYADFGIDDKNCMEEHEQWPTFYTVLHNILTSSGTERKRGWGESLQRSCEWLCMQPLASAICVPRKVPIEKLFHRPVIIEMNRLAPWEKIFWTSVFLRQYKQHIMSRKSEYNKLQHVLAVEEAQHIFYQPSLAEGGEMDRIADIFLRECREHGEGVVIITQSPSLLSVPAAANVNAVLCHRMRHAADVDAAGAMMGLTRMRDRNIYRLLKKGEAVASIAGRAPLPFLAKIPLATVERRRIEDEELRVHTARLMKRLRLGEEMKEISRESFEEPIEVVSSMSSQDVGDKTKEIISVTGKGKKKRMILSDSDMLEVGIQEEVMLKHINELPFAPTTERYKELKWDRNTGRKIQEKLVTKGLVRMESVPDPTSGRRTLYELTPMGRRVLRNLGEIPATYKTGGLLHGMFVHTLAQYCQTYGYFPTVEKPLEGRVNAAVDLHLERTPEAERRPEHPILRRHNQVAIEVETGKSQMVENITKCLDAGYDLVVSIGIRKTVVERIMYEAQIARVIDDPRLHITDIRTFMGRQAGAKPKYSRQA